MPPNRLRDTAPSCPKCNAETAEWLTAGRDVLHCPNCHYEAADVEL